MRKRCCRAGGPFERECGRRSPHGQGGTSQSLPRPVGGSGLDPRRNGADSARLQPKGPPMTPRRSRAAAMALFVSLLAAAPVAASPYSDAVRADGAVNYLRLGDAPTNTPIDVYARPKSRTLLNSGVAAPLAPAFADAASHPPAFGQPGAIAGDPDTAARFVASPRYVWATAGAELHAKEHAIEQQHLTWEAWVNPGLVDTMSRRVLADEDTYGGTLLAARADGIVFSRYMNPGQYTMYSRNSHYGAVVPKTVWGTLVAHVDRARWSHVVATYDLVTPTTNPRGTMRLYVNGSLVASRRSDFVPMEPHPASYALVGIGSNPHDSLQYDGGLDEVATYARTLSAAEVAEHYRIGTTGGGAPPPPGGGARRGGAPPRPWAPRRPPGTRRTRRTGSRFP